MRYILGVESVSSLGRIHQRTRTRKNMERAIEPTGSLLYEILNAAIALTEAQMGNVQLLDHGRLTIVAYKGFSAPFLKC